MSTNQGSSSGVPAGYYQPQNYPPQGSYVAPLKNNDGANTNNNNSSNNKEHSSSSSSSTPRTLAHALLPDLPLLMQSGDVCPEEVNPLSVATLAKLTEKYVASLVSAAMDAHDIFTDGEVVGGGACLGPPPFGYKVDDDDDDDDDDDTKRKACDAKSSTNKKRKIDYWDMPLPTPGTNKDDFTSNYNSSDLSSDNSDDDGDDNEASISIRNSIDGYGNVDVHTNERTRSYYVSAPTVMDARSFIFPVCHDPVLYQRIKEVQKSRRAIQREVVDNVIMDIMNQEGASEGRRGNVDLYDAVLSNNDDKKMAGGAGVLGSKIDPSWPGLNELSRDKLW